MRVIEKNFKEKERDTNICSSVLQFKIKSLLCVPISQQVLCKYLSWFGLYMIQNAEFNEINLASR